VYWTLFIALLLIWLIVMVTAATIGLLIHLLPALAVAMLLYRVVTKSF
jgi:hypothetical protein